MLKRRQNEVKRNIFLFDEVKKHSRTSPDVQFKEFSLTNRKLDLERTMNGLGKPFRKKSDPKNRKTVKIRVKLPHVNKKPLPRNRIFVQTPFSHSTLKLERKKIHAASPLAFSLHFLFRRDQNHYSNLTSKIMKMCEQILKKKKKRQRPNTIQIL